MVAEVASAIIAGVALVVSIPAYYLATVVARHTEEQATAATKAAEAAAVSARLPALIDILREFRRTEFTNTRYYIRHELAVASNEGRITLDFESREDAQSHRGDPLLRPARPLCEKGAHLSPRHCSLYGKSGGGLLEGLASISRGRKSQARSDYCLRGELRLFSAPVQRRSAVNWSKCALTFRSTRTPCGVRSLRSLLAKAPVTFTLAFHDMRTFKFLCVACLLWLLHGTVLAVEALATLEETRALTERAMARVAANDLIGGVRMLQPHMIAPPEHMERALGEYRFRMREALQRAGETIGYEFLGSERVGQNLIKYAYLERRENFANRWLFYFYRGKTGWTLATMRFDDNIHLLFQPER